MNEKLKKDKLYYVRGKQIMINKEISATNVITIFFYEIVTLCGCTDE